MSIASAKQGAERAPEKVSLGGVQFRPTTSNTARQAVATFLGQKQTARSRPLVIGYVNPHVVTVASQNRLVAQHLSESDHVCIDGIGVKIAMGPKAGKVERLPAHRLLDQLLGDGSLKGGIIVIGIEPELIGLAAASIVGQSTSLSLLGTSSGFAPDSEVRALLNAHNEADVVLIGAGTPRSESLTKLASEICRHALVFHCGAGSLAVYAGARSHAPRWISNAGFDWLYRFVREPLTRRRYTVGALQFLRVCASPKPTTKAIRRVTS